MTPLQRLHLLISSGLHAVGDFGHHLLKRKLLLGSLLAAASLICLLAGDRPVPSLSTSLLDAASVASDAWVMSMSNLQQLLVKYGESHGGGGVWGISTSFGMFDLKITLAVLLGATISFLFNFASTAVREGRAARAARGNAAAGHNEAGSGVAGPGPGAQPFDMQIPDNACYFCIRRPATSKCGSCRSVLRLSGCGPASSLLCRECFSSGDCPCLPSANVSFQECLAPSSCPLLLC